MPSGDLNALMEGGWSQPRCGGGSVAANQIKFFLFEFPPFCPSWKGGIISLAIESLTPLSIVNATAHSLLWLFRLMWMGLTVYYVSFINGW